MTEQIIAQQLSILDNQYNSYIYIHVVIPKIQYNLKHTERCHVLFSLYSRYRRISECLHSFVNG